MDWTGCEYVETMPDRAPVVKGSGVPAEQVLERFEHDEDCWQIARELGLDADAVSGILSFAFVQDWSGLDLSSLAQVSAPVINWSGCEYVEQVAGRMNGIPVVRESRVPAETLVNGLLLGETARELAFNFSLKLSEVQGVLAFVERRLPLAKAG